MLRSSKQVTLCACSTRACEISIHLQGILLFWVPGTSISCCGTGLFVHVLSWAVFRLFCYRDAAIAEGMMYPCRQRKASSIESQCTVCKPRSDQRSGSFRGSASSLSSWSSEGGCTPSGSGTSTQRCTRFSITTARAHGLAPDTLYQKRKLPIFCQGWVAGQGSTVIRQCGPQPVLVQDIQQLRLTNQRVVQCGGHGRKVRPPCGSAHAQFNFPSQDALIRCAMPFGALCALSVANSASAAVCL